MKVHLGRGKVKMKYVLLLKKNKQVEEKILAKKKKYENEICPGAAAKKDNIGCNACYTQSEKIPKPNYRKWEKKKQ